MKATAQALAAARAAKNVKAWGPVAAAKYAEVRGALDYFVAAVKFEKRRRH